MMDISVYPYQEVYILHATNTYYILGGKIDRFNKRIVQNNNYCLSLILSEERV